MLFQGKEELTDQSMSLVADITANQRLGTGSEPLLNRWRWVTGMTGVRDEFYSLL